MGVKDHPAAALLNALPVRILADAPLRPVNLAVVEIVVDRAGLTEGPGTQQRLGTNRSAVPADLNVLMYTDEVFVPIDPGYWSLMGVRHLEDLIEQIRQVMEHKTLRIGGVLLTKVQRTNVARDIEQEVRSYFGERVFRTTIPLNVKVEEAHSRGLSALDYAPDSPGSRAYLALTREVPFNGQDSGQ